MCNLGTINRRSMVSLILCQLNSRHRRTRRLGVVRLVRLRREGCVVGLFFRQFIIFWLISSLKLLFGFLLLLFSFIISSLLVFPYGFLSLVLGFRICGEGRFG